MIDFERLKKEQIKLSKSVILTDEFEKVEKIAGIDQAYVNNEVVSCIVVCEYKTLNVLEKQTATAKAPIPYKPGFLAYREMPAMVEAYNRLKETPDIIIVDGHGIAHPRRFGIASHFGLAISKPTIGIAKSLVVGDVEKGKIYVENELRGFELITREHAAPIYVSPGHMIAPGTALKIVKDCIRPPHKLPEPLHLAHRGARRGMKEMIEKQKSKATAQISPV